MCTDRKLKVGHRKEGNIENLKLMLPQFAEKFSFNLKKQFP